MYSTCIYCQKPLGGNEVIEEFPIGRRLAFDAAKGRLWVVCRHCERWNLSPLETRWEAIEACEAQFHNTRLRVSTDNIGLARLREGLELVRIGDPQRPEFAAWRYGDQFGRRRRRTMVIGGGIAVAVGAVVVGGAAAGIGLGGFGGLWANIPNIVNNMRFVRVKTPDGQVIRVRGTEFTRARLTADRESHEPTLSFKHKRRIKVFHGEEALQMAGSLLPAINRSGGGKRVVAEAVDQIETARGSEGFIDELLDGRIVRLDTFRRGRLKPKAITELPKPTRLAIEMALHEEAERKAIAGELAVLEAAWREAEEIADIADNMFLPQEVEQQLEKLKSTSNIQHPTSDIQRPGTGDIET
jgi:hypothetical protein